MPPVCWTVRSALRNAPSRCSMEKCSGRSFDSFTDRKAAQLLHAFDTKAGLVLAHIDIDEVSEIYPPSNCLANSRSRTAPSRFDALHCQKKPSRPA